MHCAHCCSRVPALNTKREKDKGGEGCSYSSQNKKKLWNQSIATNPDQKEGRSGEGQPHMYRLSADRQPATECQDPSLFWNTDRQI